MKNFIKWPLKTLVKDFKYFRDSSFYLLTKGKTAEKPLVRLEKEGAPTNYDRPVCFFCSYDSENIIRENVYYYLDKLVRAGFDIVFISSSDTIADADWGRLSECCIKIINRENRGYDFYGWKTGIEKYPQYRSHPALLLANDSVLGPLFDIRDIISKLENCDADIIGMTNCFHFHSHLQSYFLYCKKAVVLSDEFLSFFQEINALELKIAIIRKYEVGFSRTLSHRFRIAALYDLEHVLAHVSYHKKPMKWIEPTFHLWKPLITEFKFPFLKKSLITRMGVSVEEISKVLTESNSTYNLEILSGSTVRDNQKPSPASASISE